MEVKVGNSALVVLTDVDTSDAAAFDRWYEEVHIAERMEIDGVLSARRFVIDSARSGPQGILGANAQPAQRYFTIYELSDGGVLDSAQWQQLRTNHSDLTLKMTGDMRNVIRGTYSLRRTF